MKRSPANGVMANAGKTEALRQQAERIAEDKASMLPERLSALTAGDARRMLHDLQVHQIELELQNEELRRAQVALDISRARYFDLYDLAPVGYFTLGEDGLILEANLTGATLLGIARGALVGQSLSRFLVGDAADNFYLRNRLLFKSGLPQGFELLISRPVGAPFSAWVEASVVPNNDGVRACRVVISDITERKVIGEKLRHSEALLQTAGEIAQIGGWAIKLPQNELRWSDEICTILEFPKGAVPLLGEALSLYPPASHEIISGALEACARNGIPFDCELEIFTAKRRQLNVRVIGQAVRDDHGNIAGIDGAFQDITGRKKAELARVSLEAQLRESQKMEAIGTLAGGIAHDFNNILGTILGNVELARQDARASWQALVSLEEIRKAGHRARDLVQQILTFSRRQPTSRRMMTLTSVIEESVRLLRVALPGGVRIACRCALDTPAVFADPTQVQQVLLNLGANAIHSMEGIAGEIEICIEGITLDADSARFDLNLRPGRYARIIFRDTGHGMDAVTQARIFEPFFTTKPAGKGTGLGLSVAQGIMQAHEGVIVVRSKPGEGSAFELYFPCARGDATAHDTTKDVWPASEGRGQHILYVDDDEAQVFLIKRMLERWGYRVSAFIEQREALDALLAGELYFDLVITDYNMPGLSGLEIARAARDAKPELPVIVVSAYITDALRAQAAAVGVRELIAKTHAVEELRDIVHRLVMSKDAI